MIELFYGLPGDGKTYSAFLMLLKLLEREKCFICHNLPVPSLARVVEYLEKKCPHVVNVLGRLRFLEDAEVGHFWRVLGPGIEIKTMKEIQLGNGRVLKVPNYDFLGDDFPGVMYILDEAHIHFSAYKWAEVSEEAMWAVSQHRHLGMEIVLVSQHPEKVAKALRRDIHRFTRVKNFGNRRTMGFVAKGRFRRVTYPELPTKVGEQMIEEQSWFKLDKEIADLYSTNAGVGIVGRVFNVERKPKGLSPKALFAIVPLVGIAVMCLPYFGTRMIAGGLTHWAKSGNKGMVQSFVRAEKPVAKVDFTPTNAQGLLVRNAAAWQPGPKGAIVDEGADLWVVRYTWCRLTPDLCTWVLSNGRVVDLHAKGFTAGGVGWCEIAGRRLEYRPPIEAGPSAWSPAAPPGHILGSGPPVFSGLRRSKIVSGL